MLLDEEQQKSASEQLSAEALGLLSRCKWYFSMLERLERFGEESSMESLQWLQSAETWREELLSFSRTLAEQRAVLTRLAMEQEITSTSLPLNAEQVRMADKQVKTTTDTVSSQVKQLGLHIRALETQVSGQTKP